MDVKVVTVEGEPVDGAVVSLSSVPNNGTFPEIASLTDEQGMANVICEHVAGEYVFSIDCSSPDDRSFDVFVDGVLLRGVAAKATGGKVSAVGAAARLSAGVHEIRLSNAKAWMPDIDRMTVASQAR